MSNKIKTFVIVAIFALCAALIVVAITTRSPKEETYEYEGFIVAMQPSGADLTLTTINAGGQSEFVLRNNASKEIKTKSGNISAGDYIQLTTKKDSETDIKKCLVFNAYSSKGKIVNVEGEDAPFLLATTETNTLKMYKLIPATGTIPAMPTGTPVKIYYQYELNNASAQVVADVIYPLSDTTVPLTEGELFHIEDVMDYTLAGADTE